MNRNPFRMNPLALALATMALANSQAWSATPGTPDAGSLLLQLQPSQSLGMPPAAVPGTPRTDNQVPAETAPGAAPGQSMRVQGFQIKGNTRIDSSVLLSLVADSTGQRLSLSQLQALARRITDHYRAAGYPLARALVPSQVVEDGTVQIEVSEGRYGTISLDNQSRVSSSLLQSTLAPLRSGEVIADAQLETTVRLLSEISGAAINAVLRPGQSTGTADLVIEVRPTAALTGYGLLDNGGNDATGRAHLSATLNLSNLLQWGDVLSLTALSSGSGLNYLRPQFETLVDGRGTRLGTAYTTLRYKLGGAYANLLGHGNADTFSLWLRRPLWRSQSSSLNARLQLDSQAYNDDIDANASYTRRKAKVASAGLSGETQDNWLQGGYNAWSAGITWGTLDRRATASAETKDRFSRINLSFTRLQGLSPSDRLYLSLSGQLAGTNLDPSQKMIGGGSNGVRAYDNAALSGDSGLLANLELRHDLPASGSHRWQALGFVDAQSLTVNKNPAPGTPLNSARLAGAGAGLSWQGPGNWDASIQAARQLGATPALLSSNARYRVWGQLRKSL